MDRSPAAGWEFCLEAKRDVGISDCGFRIAERGDAAGVQRSSSACLRATGDVPFIDSQGGRFPNRPLGVTAALSGPPIRRFARHPEPRRPGSRPGRRDRPPQRRLRYTPKGGRRSGVDASPIALAPERVLGQRFSRCRDLVPRQPRDDTHLKWQKKSMFPLCLRHLRTEIAPVFQTSG